MNTNRFVQLCLALFVVMCAPVVGFAGVIAMAVNSSNGHTYYLLESASWTVSEAEAVSLGGHLVTINDQAENDWVEGAFKIYGDEFWTGYTDSEFEKVWKWVDGNPAAFINWGGVEPNDGCAFGPEDYAIFMTNGVGLSASIQDREWADIPDDASCGQITPIRGIVEFEGIVSALPYPSRELWVGAARPNPTIGHSIIEFDLPTDTDVRVNIYELAGRLVAHLAEGNLTKGRHRVGWNGLDSNARAVRPGFYFYLIQIGKERTERKIVIIR